MAEEIVIGKLIIDTSDLESSMASSKKAIVDLENEQKKLKKDTDGLTAANEEQLQSFVENETELKKLKAEYAANQKSILELTKAQTGLDSALKANISTQEQAKKNTAELTIARQKIDATTLEGAKAIAEINAKIDQNNSFIAANSSQLEQQKINVGNYTDSIREAANNLNPFNGGLSGFVDRAKEAGGAGNLAKQSLGGMATGFLGVARAGLAFIATPVGAFIAALVVVFGSIKAAMDRSSESTAKITKIFSAFGAIVNIVLKAVSVLGDYWINAYVKIMEKVGQASEDAMKAISGALEFLGFSEAAKSVDKFTESTKASIKASMALADAEKTLEKEQRKARLTQLQYQKEAEKFRQVRDDENKTIAERIKANEDLGQVLKKQLKDELAIAKLALKIANDRIKAEGQSSALLDAQADALTEIADIEERITGQESEQLANRVSLQKEAAAKQKEIEDRRKERADKAFQESIKRAQNEIDILKLQANQSNLTAEQKIANAQKVFELETKLANRTSSGSELTKKQLENRQNLSSAILQIADEQINKELDAQKEAIEKSKALTQEEFDKQKQSAEDLATAQIMLLNKKLLSEKALADETLKINQAKADAIATIDAKAAEAKKLADEQALINTRALEQVAFEIRMQDIQDRNATEAEIQKALLAENYANELLLLEESLADKQISNELYLQEKLLAEKRYNADVKKNDKILADQKRALNNQMLTDATTALTALFGENKAVAVAAALINTYQGITAGVKLGYPAAIPAVAAAAATGFAAVKNILKTNKGSSGGGESSAGAVTTTGTASFVNSAQTETVARVTEAPQPNNTVVTPPVLILENLMEAQNNLAVKMQSS
jgi:hypothetical protein